MTGNQPAAKDAEDPIKLKEDDKPSKLLRVITVSAYIFSVSFAALMLSLYYIFLWSKLHLEYISFSKTTEKFSARNLSWNSKAPEKSVYQVPTSHHHGHSQALEGDESDYMPSPCNNWDISHNINHISGEVWVYLTLKVKFARWKTWKTKMKSAIVKKISSCSRRKHVQKVVKCISTNQNNVSKWG